MVFMLKGMIPPKPAFLSSQNDKVYFERVEHSKSWIQWPKRPPIAGMAELWLMFHPQTSKIAYLVNWMH
jgi:hypothetical protein